MGALAWMGVLVGWNSGSPCHQMWDPVSNKVHNVGVAHADFDEEVKVGWWHGQNVGKKGKLHDTQEVSSMTWPNLQEGSQTVGGGNSGSEQRAQENLHSVDEQIPDVVENPLPQLLGAPPL